LAHQRGTKGEHQFGQPQRLQLGLVESLQTDWSFDFKTMQLGGIKNSANIPLHNQHLILLQDLLRAGGL
jgi:hypothetical protein